MNPAWITSSTDFSFYGTPETEDHYVFLTRKESNLGDIGYPFAPVPE